jgi:toxin-antitoxin system PIN domain toxin
MRALLDTNTWIALTVETHPHHAPARRWYEAAPLSRGELLFCRPTEISFLRLITQKRVMQACSAMPLTNEEAIHFLNGVHHDEAVARVEEPPATRSLWLELSKFHYAAPNVWMDAYLSAFAIALGASFVTFDRGFQSYESNGLDLHMLELA